MHRVDREAYLNYAKNLLESEVDLIDSFEEWLPENIIDCHAHCNLQDHVKEIDDRALNHLLSTFPSFSLKESYEYHSLLHPSKEIYSLRFPQVFRGLDHKAANLYLLQNSPKKDCVALYGLPNDIDYTVSMLEHERVVALKMYRSYLEPPATEIYQYFPKAILEVAQSLDIPLVLHPPQRIDMCLDQILQLANDFPKLRFCLAHLALSKNVVEGLRETFNTLAQYEQIHFDTALVPSEDIVFMALQSVGKERIMYGSDEPLHLVRSVPYDHPVYGGDRLISKYKYHWINEDDYKKYSHFAEDAVHAHWLALIAIRGAIERFSSIDEQDLIRNNIFYNNAKEFYSF